MKQPRPTQTQVNAARQDAEDWRKRFGEAAEKAERFRELAEGLGKAYARVTEEHIPTPKPGYTCNHCRQQSLLTTLSAYTGKRRKDWGNWRVDDYE